MHWMRPPSICAYRFSIRGNFAAEHQRSNWISAAAIVVIAIG
jgi:hypothetical protein